MSKILIVPDVHGRTFWHRATELVDKVDQIVFLGDYLDPYPHEGISFDEAFEEFNEILEFKKEYPDLVTLLVGNHDMHYIINEFMNCSRRNIEMQGQLHDLYNSNLELFKLIHTEDDWMFSHAGVYKNWMEKYEFTLDDLNLQNFLNSQWPALEDLSWYRGGNNSVGSCIWADIRESVNYGLIPNYKQVVGHTQLNEKPYISDKISCLDVRRCFILDTETNEINEPSEEFSETTN
jgi:hypothetical protein